MTVNDKALDSKADPDLIPDTRSGELWRIGQNAVYLDRKILRSLVAVLVAVSLFFAARQGYRIYRVASNETLLQALEADYAWLHQTYDISAYELPNESQQKLAELLGSVTVSDISLVKIRHGHPSDQQLDFLESLHQARSIELQSNRATNQTLETLSELPNLRYLTVIGQNFTIEGLLKLREAPRLREIRCDTKRYTPIELAVLQSELPQVRIYNADTARLELYRSIVHDSAPAA